MPSLTPVNRPPPADHVFKTLLEAAANGPLPDWDRVQEALEVRSFEAGATVFPRRTWRAIWDSHRWGSIELRYACAVG